MAVNELS